MNFRIYNRFCEDWRQVRISMLLKSQQRQGHSSELCSNLKGPFGGKGDRNCQIIERKMLTFSSISSSLKQKGAFFNESFFNILVIDYIFDGQKFRRWMNVIEI